jgi:excisionase family DNA binding protein
MSNIEQFLSPQELSKKLNVPVNTIYYWVSKDVIPYIKMGKHNRFDFDEVMNHFKKNTRKKLKNQESE